MLTVIVTCKHSASENVVVGKSVGKTLLHCQVPTFSVGSGFCLVASEQHNITPQDSHFKHDLTQNTVLRQATDLLGNIKLMALHIMEMRCCRISKNCETWNFQLLIAVWGNDWCTQYKHSTAFVELIMCQEIPRGNQMIVILLTCSRVTVIIFPDESSQIYLFLYYILWSAGYFTSVRRLLDQIKSCNCQMTKWVI